MIAPACRNDVAHSLKITEIKFSILQKLTRDVCTIFLFLSHLNPTVLYDEVGIVLSPLLDYCDKSTNKDRKESQIFLKKMLSFIKNTNTASSKERNE